MVHDLGKVVFGTGSATMRLCSGVVMRSKLQGQMATWQVRTWDVITVAAMLTMSVLGALWMIKLG
jgi:hypothetical protein